MESEFVHQAEAETEGIRVGVATAYVPERSVPYSDVHFFAYRITITNGGHAPAQLLKRHWRITDALGRVEHVDGPGVVGQTPYLEPGEQFVYTSFCPLPTDFGSMHGSYDMVRPDGTMFSVKIPPFNLVRPLAIN